MTKKRPGSDLPAAKLKRPSVSKVQSNLKPTEVVGHPTTGGKGPISGGSFEKEPVTPGVTKGGMPPSAASGSAAGSHGGILDRLKSPAALVDPFNPPGIVCRVKSYIPSSGSTENSPSVGNVAYDFLRSLSADASRGPDVQLFAKNMLKAVPKSNRQTIKGYESANLDAINSLLAEVYHLALSNFKFLFPVAAHHSVSYVSFCRQ